VCFGEVWENASKASSSPPLRGLSVSGEESPFIPRSLSGASPFSLYGERCQLCLVLHLEVLPLESWRFGVSPLDRFPLGNLLLLWALVALLMAGDLVKVRIDNRAISEEL